MSVAGLKKQFYKASQVRRGRAIGAGAWLGGPRRAALAPPGLAGKGKPGPRAVPGYGVCASRRLSKSSGGAGGRAPPRGACRQASRPEFYPRDSRVDEGNPGFQAVSIRDSHHIA